MDGWIPSIWVIKGSCLKLLVISKQDNLKQQAMEKKVCSWSFALSQMATFCESLGHIYGGNIPDFLEKLELWLARLSTHMIILIKFIGMSVRVIMLDYIQMKFLEKLELLAP